MLFYSFSGRFYFFWSFLLFSFFLFPVLIFQFHALQLLSTCIIFQLFPGHSFSYTRRFSLYFQFFSRNYLLFSCICFSFFCFKSLSRFLCCHFRFLSVLVNRFSFLGLSMFLLNTKQNSERYVL